MYAPETLPQPEHDTRAVYLASVVDMFANLLDRQRRSPGADPEVDAVMRAAAQALARRAHDVARQWTQAQACMPSRILQAAPHPPAPVAKESAAGVAMAVDYLRYLENHLVRHGAPPDAPFSEP